MANKKSASRIGLWLGLVGLLVVVLIGWLWLSKPKQEESRYVEQEVTRGDLQVTVTATGNLQATKSVDISSELSGTVSKVWVDYNDPVKKGQILIELDTTKLKQTIDKSKADLLSKQAALAQVQATLKQAQTTLARQEEVSRLSGGKVPAATELDVARATVEKAQADVAAAQANVMQAKATLSANETDLTKATIRSPIDGVVLTRSIEPGQTVAASLSAPTLLSLAEDLTEMQLIVLVSEADVSQVRAGQTARFTVDAFSGKSYPAEVLKVRLGSKTVDNVVSYQTVLVVKNRDLSLMPGMTASADVLVNQKKDVMLVPNAALRFKPAETAAAKRSGGVLSFLLPRPPSNRSANTARPSRPDRASGAAMASAVAHAGSRAEGAASRPSRAGRGDKMAAASEPELRSGRVWVKSADGQIHPIAVQVGASDGKNTEVVSDRIKVGDRVVTGLAAASKS